MDRNTAIDRLPEAYAAALRLQDDGHDDNAIAARLDLAPAAVGPLLRVATAKLHTILAADKRARDLSPRGMQHPSKAVTHHDESPPNA
jgi:hypothetical protein